MIMTMKIWNDVNDEKVIISNENDEMTIMMN